MYGLPGDLPAYYYHNCKSIALLLASKLFTPNQTCVLVITSCLNIERIVSQVVNRDHPSM